MKLFSLWICLAWMTIAMAGDYPRFVKVKAVHDGDTLTLIDGTRARLWGVDAPELAQPGGPEARDALTALVAAPVILITGDHGTSYHRYVVEMMVNGRDVGLEMIRSGMAWYSPCYAPHRNDYAWAMLEAAVYRRGLWSDAMPTPPWEWRKGQYGKVR